VDLGKALDSIHREILQYKLRRKRTSGNMVKCITEMYDGIRFCVKRGEDKVTGFIEQNKEVRQGCSLSRYLVDIFIDITHYIGKDNPQATVIGTTTIPGLLLVDDLSFSSFTIIGIHKATDQVTKYCRE
jgi:hypothetical protein